MNFKTLVLGSAAAMMTVTGAQAADLPAEPVDYVRVCDAYGSGFYYLPGTDTCLKVGGRVRYDVRVTDRDNAAGDWRFDSRARGYVALDSRTETDYGLLRTFTRIHATVTGTTAAALALEYGFIQWGGFTFGRTESFFDTQWYGGYDLYSAIGVADYFQYANVAAYTFDVGNGISATLSLEDAVTDGTATAFNDDEDLPDVVLSVRGSQSWGSFDLAVGVQHQSDTDGDIAATVASPALNVGGVTIPAVAATPGIDNGSDWGWGVTAGIEINVPIAGVNDKIGVNVGYSEDAPHFAPTFDSYIGQGVISHAADSEVFHVSAGFKHYFSSDFSVAISGSYTDVDNQNEALIAANTTGTATDWDAYAVAVTAGWTPVSGLFVGGEIVYNEVSFAGGADVETWGGVFRVQRTF